MSSNIGIVSVDYAENVGCVCLQDFLFFLFLKEKQKKQEQNWKNKKWGGGGHYFAGARSIWVIFPNIWQNLPKQNGKTKNVLSMRSTATTQMFEILIGEYSLSNVSVRKCGLGKFLPRPPPHPPHPPAHPPALITLNWEPSC